MANPLQQIMALLQGSPMSMLPAEPGVRPGFGLAGAGVSRFDAGSRPFFDQQDLDDMMKGAQMATPMKTGQVVYHGTTRDFKRFDLNAPKTTLGGLNKYGVFVSPDPKVASRYAMDFGPEGANVRQLRLGTKKVLELKPAEYDSLQRFTGMIDRGEKLNEIQQISLEDLMAKLNAAPGVHPIEAVKKAGYEAISRPASGLSEAEILVLNPKKLKSIVGQGGK